MKKFVWLFGENVGQTACNNSFYFWKQIVKKDDGIEKYFVMERNRGTMAVYRGLDSETRKYVVWRNSVKHFALYFSADLFFVSLSYRDVRPEHFLWRDFNFLTETPIIYLQHGTLGIKKINYTGESYNNNIFRFFYYNPFIKKELLEVNGFREYQLYYAQFHPRYMELIRKSDQYQKNGAGQKKETILWFLTWREYQKDDYGILKLYLTVKYIISNREFQQYLEANNLELELCFHRNFNLSGFEKLFEDGVSPCIKYSYADRIDVMEKLAQSQLLITDYSSVGFDFTLLNKPVILFMPDLEEYQEYREFYCDLEEIKKYSISGADGLMDCIMNRRYGINPFFRERMPENIDYDYLRAGKHIEKMYEDLSHIQRHKITFIGYNFYGIGGTVLATRALAEALLQKGYLVQLLSLVQRGRAENVPCGLNMRAMYVANRKTIKNLLKRGMFHGQKRFYGYLKYDTASKVLNPYAGYGMSRWMKTARSETVISTRESLHLFLYDAKSPYIKNKIYFYHCAAAVLDDIFPGCMEQLKKIQVEKAVFVSDNNRKGLAQLKQYDGYADYLVLGNALDSSRMISREEIRPVPQREVYKGIYLLRISRERRADIENLLNYGRYLKERGCDRIVIDVYGRGDLLEEFFERLLRERLDQYIRYCGFVQNPKEVFAEHDAVVDFSLHNSFGMSYIEGVLNGKMVFCMENEGSSEVMEGIPDAFIRSFDDLTDKMLTLPERTKAELEKNYDRIAERYSRDVVGSKIIEYIYREK